MKESNYWQQFLNTGKVEDYLRFRQETEGADKEKLMTGDNPYAGICEVNRDGFEGGPYRGIR